MNNCKECHDYDDIINLPHYFPPDRVRMPRASRAAQFAPFAALTGYDRAIETATDVFNTKNYGDELQNSSQLLVDYSLTGCYLL